MAGYRIYTTDGRIHDFWGETTRLVCHPSESTWRLTQGEQFVALFNRRYVLAIYDLDVARKNGPAEAQ